MVFTCYVAKYLVKLIILKGNDRHMKKNSFLEGTIVATLVIIFTKILGILYVIPFYSIIGTQGSALYSYAYNIYLIFLSISSAGIPIAMSKIVSEYDSLNLKEAKVRSFSLGILIVSILSAICFIFLFFFAENVATWIIGDMTGGVPLADITMVIFVVSFSVLIIPFLSVARGYLQGHNFINPSSISQMIEQVVRIIVILAGSFVTIKILNKSVSFGVAVAISGAFFGGLAAIIYILGKILNNKKQLSLGEKLKRDNVSNKEILKKIFYYSIPFVIINVTVNIYNTVDMSLILRTLSKIGFTGSQSEFVASAITTWGYKLNMIVTSLATGLTVSLIPNLVRAFTLKDYKQVNNIFTKALQIILFISVPAAFGLSFLSSPVWTVFYGVSELGPIVFRLSVVVTIFCNVYLVSIQVAQSLNLYKTVYIAVLLGFLTNICLDVPLMHLFSFLGIPAFYGASTATMLGYSISIFIVLWKIRRIKEIKYKQIFIYFVKVMSAVLCMLILLSILKIILPFNTSTRLLSIVYIAIYSIVGGVIYFFITYKMKLIQSLFGEDIIKKLLKIVTFGKYGDRNGYKRN